MGSGKSTVGKILAEKLHFDYLDSDTKIEEQKGMTSRDIFIKFGEHEFRNQESKLLDESAKKENLVVSCGGGVILDSMNRDVLNNETCYFLDGDEEVFFDRIKDNTNLPNAFLDVKDETLRKEKFAKLYHSRLPLYEECASKKIIVDKKTPEEIADEIIRSVQ